MGLRWDDEADLALTAHAIATSALTSLASGPSDETSAETFSLVDRDLGILVPG